MIDKITFLTRVLFCLFFWLVCLPQSVFAETSAYRSAGWVAADGDTAYTTDGCKLTDSNYCSRPSASGGANLYFSSFGTLVDFGIPQNATITKIHIRIKGKNNIVQRIYLDRGKNKKPLSQLCQYPFDLWQLFLGSTGATREFHTVFIPFSSGGNNLGNCFTAELIDNQNYTFSIYDVESSPWSADIDNFEIAFDYTPPAVPTATPTISTTPTPAPFLDLPWDYETEMSFNDAALSINSYFDHTYPLLSSGFEESPQFLQQLTIYTGKSFTERARAYSSHDGYDYGGTARVKFGDPVLAAAAGTATLIKENHSSGGGNVIRINHNNGYQTWYEHLQLDGLIVSDENEEVNVVQGQQIGKVGFTGNCWIPDSHGNKIYNTPACAHIHFSVFQDKNKDGNFEDNIPDGVTDPFGWQSTDPDPWENYSFFYNGEQRTGNKSYYLWKKKIDGLQANLPSNGGIFHVGRYTVDFPEDSTRSGHNLTLQSSPVVNVLTRLQSLGPSLKIEVKDSLNNLITFFTQPITIVIDFNGIDLSRFDLGTTNFAIYSSDDLTTWQKEETSIDTQNKKAETKINHLTYFALMAERADIVAPTTSVSLQGSEGQQNWFRSDVQLILDAKDNEGGLGVDYTLYKIAGAEWQIYSSPLVFTVEGNHTVSFYSVDKDGNSEDVKTVEFVIDKTLPEANITYDLAKFDLQVLGNDSSGETTVTSNNASSLHPQFVISDLARNKLVINVDKIKIGKQVSMSIKSLQYNETSIKKLENNIFFTFVLTEKNNKVKQLDQYFSVKDDKKIFTNYSSSTNITKIYTKTLGSTKYVQENKQRIVLLKLYTQNGTLKYSY